MSDEYAIRVQDVSKMYKLYSKNSDRVRDALGLTRKKLYKEHYALHHLSFDVKKGETMGIIGTNGAGKSTILKIITGVLSPTEGNVQIDGRISALLELGAGFDMEYTGIENIYLNGTMIGFSREEIDRKLQDILDFADIGDFVYQPVKTYSSGMFVRLAFAVAINIDPEILIVDEALSVGDVFFQNKCYKKFDEFKKMGRTILFVSHDLSSISRYCDRVVLLDHGNKLAEGTPNNMINLYKKVLVHQVDDQGRDVTSIPADRTGETGPAATDWKQHLTRNPHYTEYGDKKAEIIDYAVLDEDGIITSSIMKGSRFTIRVRIKIHEDVHYLISSYTFKTLKGTEVTGTNTMFENAAFDYRPGDIKTVTFTQEMNLQGGEYLLSLGCTGYNNREEFEVHHRLYDVVNISVISNKNIVGFYDMNSVVTID